MGTAPPSGHPHVALKLRSAIDRRTSRPADYLLCQVRRREVRLAQDSGRAAQGPSPRPVASGLDPHPCRSGLQPVRIRNLTALAT